MSRRPVGKLVSDLLDATDAALISFLVVRFRIVMLAVAVLLPAYNVIFFVWPFP